MNEIKNLILAIDPVQRNISTAYLIILSKNCQSLMMMSTKTDINIYKTERKNQLLDGKYPFFETTKENIVCISNE